MRAIILAAGEGMRLRPYTKDRPKCLVELAGKPLLVHQVEALQSTGIADITVVTGYHASQIEALGYPTRRNPDYARTNMVASLICARDLLDGADDVLIAYGDIVYERRIIQALVACPQRVCTTVDRSWRRLWELRHADPLSDAETLKLDEVGNIIELGRRPNSYDDIEGQYMGLIKVCSDAAPQLVASYQQLDATRQYDGKDLPNMYMTSFLQHLIDHGRNVCAVPIDGGWLEIDSAADLELYNTLHGDGRLSTYWQPPATAECLH